MRNISRYSSIIKSSLLATLAKLQSESFTFVFIFSKIGITFKRKKFLLNWISSFEESKFGIKLFSSQYFKIAVIETIPPKVKKNSENINVIIDDLGEYYIGDKKLTIKKYEEKELFVFPEATSNFVYVDLSKIKMPLTIRTRQDGDMISPFGMSGSMKLKKYLNSKCIPRHNRDNLLLLTDKKEILWVIGVGISNKIGVVDTPTHVIEINNR